MRDHFEVRDHDAAGRIGRLEVPRAGVTVETPALLPVVNPNVRTIAPGRLREEFGAEMLITNAYIAWSTDGVRDRVLDEGIHEFLGFDGAIMTDSGSFQLAEYGDIDVTTAEILAFQRRIGSDVATPVDVPTPPDVGRERAERELATTEAALADAEAADTGEMLVNAPVQGSTHVDLREAAGRHAVATDLDVFPVGAMVPLLNAYRYADVVAAVRAAKRGLGPGVPVHLFGAGHPLMLALAVAAGCDLFDSAAYALMARDGRYLTVAGTERLAEMEHFPCSCPVCAEHTPAEVRGLDGGDETAGSDRPTTERLLAEHNLHVAFEELRRVKAAIRSGNLLELVDRRARGHPAMLDGYRALLDHGDELERTDPGSKGTFFYTSHEAARRPEVRRHRDRLRRLSPPGDLLVTESSPPSNHDHDAVWRIKPPFGPYPPALAETYPLTAEVPERTDDAAAVAAAEGVAALAAANPETAVTLGHDGWCVRALDRLPARIETRDLRTVG